MFSTLKITLSYFAISLPNPGCTSSRSFRFAINHRVRSAIALAICAACFGNLSVNAQTNTSENFNFENIEAEQDDGWSFTSEDETISVQDELGELESYSIDESTDKEVRLVEEDGRWGNRGKKPDYSIEADIFDY